MPRPENAFQRSCARIFRRVVAWLVVVACPVVIAGPACVVVAAVDLPPSASSPAEEMGEEDGRSRGCLSCHRGIEPMHASTAVRVGCADCHGGDPAAAPPAGAGPGSSEYERAKWAAHVAPRRGGPFTTSANPPRTYTALNDEDLRFVRFFNPGDLRVAGSSCGASGCHGDIVTRVQTSMMAHGAMLWAAALYNNGSFPLKDAAFGESYSQDGRPARLVADPPPAPEETLVRGWLPFLQPLPRYELTQPGNILRIFERGGRRPLETGLPDREEEPGRPARRLSARGLGTLTRTDPVFLNLQKTRLLDPTLNFLGTNDHPGDYRSSGCTACHVIYANDDSPAHSGPWAGFGRFGRAAGGDPTVPRQERGHPIRHQLTRSIPSSQCVVCHVHPGTNVLNAYYGTIWWDNETDGEAMYPKSQRYPTPEQERAALEANPEGASVRGLWSDPSFLERIEDLNPLLKRTQFSGFAGHGFVFRNVYKQDRRGHLLDAEGRIVGEDDPDRFRKAVHLQDIHLERGMHCVDCHFEQDCHGTGRLHGETRGAVEIDCVDCHGDVDRKATLLASAAAGGGGRTLAAGLTPFGRRRFVWRGERLHQRSMLEPDREWEVVQVRDTIDPSSPHYSEASRLAKTLRRDGTTWGDVPGGQDALAHPSSRMTCASCHTSWATSCFGCHLPMKADVKSSALHNEGDTTRNYTSYSFQTLRTDVFMVGRDGTVTGRRVSPVRSACAVLVSSQNANREWVYSQQQTVSAEGFAGTAFSPFVPHTVRGRETKTCTDCHVSAAGDNNAWMASVLMQGTGFVNFLGRYAYVGEGAGEPGTGGEGRGGFEAVVVTERDEPQAVIGSDLHRLAFPDLYRRHLESGSRLSRAVFHPAEEIRSLQLRGEYLYAACGRGGLRVFDVANIDNKGLSEKVVTAPVSPLGQRLFVRTRDAAAVVSPSTLAIDPGRARRPENQEGPIHPLYGYLYVADREEGLVVVAAGTLLDGDPSNNFLSRAATFNPDGLLKGACCLTLAGETAYVGCDRGLVLLSLADPLHPRVIAELASPEVRAPRAIAVQFRYAFVLDEDGVKVYDVTFPASPRRAAQVPLEGGRDLTLARTYAFVAAGARGLGILDIERPEAPRLLEFFDGGEGSGRIDDTRSVRIGMTNASLFAYVADGRNGLRVIQLASPEDTPGIGGFSPELHPRLVATYPTRRPALALSRGLDRDRAVDESGNQLAVFGRRGSRPFDAEEAARMYLRDGRLYTVTDAPPGPPRPFVLSSSASSSSRGVRHDPASFTITRERGETP